MIVSSLRVGSKGYFVMIWMGGNNVIYKIVSWLNIYCLFFFLKGIIVYIEFKFIVWIFVMYIVSSFVWMNIS